MVCVSLLKSSTKGGFLIRRLMLNCVSYSSRLWRLSKRELLFSRRCMSIDLSKHGNVLGE